MSKKPLSNNIGTYFLYKILSSNTLDYCKEFIIRGMNFPYSTRGGVRVQNQIDGAKTFLVLKVV